MDLLERRRRAMVRRANLMSRQQLEVALRDQVAALRAKGMDGFIESDPFVRILREKLGK